MKLLLIISLILFSASPIARAQTRITRAQTKEAEQGLAQMGYWTGKLDGLFDDATRAALMAFQKWEGRSITGKLTVEELNAIRTTISLNVKTDDNPKTGPWPKPKEAGYPHVEVDLDRQVMLIVDEKDAVSVLPVSTGNGKPFIEDGQQSIAYTPRGRFVVYDKSIGWEKGYLGSMYYSNYISGGVAIHGHPTVPAIPASHGCIRIPMFAAREVSKLLTLGTIVLVYDRMSFVSAKEWVEKPELKEAAMAKSAHWDYDYYRVGATSVIKKARRKLTRSDE